MSRALRIGWASLALVAFVVVPLRLTEIVQAHADKVLTARWAATSTGSK